MASHPVVVPYRQSWLRRTAHHWYDTLGPWLCVLAVILVIALLAFVYLAQASYVARQIDMMAKLEKDRCKLHEENSALLLEIAQYEDVSRIKTEARAMGLGEPTRIEYVEVTVDDPLPLPGSRGGPLSDVRGAQLPAPQGPAFLSGIWQQFRNWIIGGTVRADQPSR